MKYNNVTQRKKSSFSKAFFFLTAKQKWAMDVLYAFCRQVDDIVDEHEDSEWMHAQLGAWLQFLQAMPAQHKDPLKQSLIDLKQAFPQLCVGDLQWIVLGMQQDIDFKRMSNLSKLLLYCDAVAGAVGLCILSIVGLSRGAYYDYAIYTGRALQLTNILRDVNEDWQRKRIYISEDILPVSNLSFLTKNPVNSNPKDQAEVTEIQNVLHQAKQSVFDQAKQCFMLSENFKFESKSDYKKALATQVMREAYKKILYKMKRQNFSNKAKKISLSKYEKLSMMLKFSLCSLFPSAK